MWVDTSELHSHALPSCQLDVHADRDARYAANAIVLPSLDMYSNLLPKDASDMIDHVLTTSVSTTSTTDSSSKSEDDVASDITKGNATDPAGAGTTDYRVSSPFWTHWRGRYGTSEAEQAQLWSLIDPSDTHTATSLASSTSVQRAAHIPGSESKAQKEMEKMKEKVSLVFRTFEGERKVVSAFLGDSLLDVARREDLPSMEGTCEGNLGESISFAPISSFVFGISVGGMNAMKSGMEILSKCIPPSTPRPLAWQSCPHLIAHVPFTSSHSPGSRRISPLSPTSYRHPKIPPASSTIQSRL